MAYIIDSRCLHVVVPPSQGAQEVFRELPHEYVSPRDLKDVVESGGMQYMYTRGGARSITQSCELNSDSHVMQMVLTL